MPPSTRWGRIYGRDVRSDTTGITLIAGFASTVAWPLSSFGLATFRWRETCCAWALAHFVIGLAAQSFAPARRSRTHHRRSR
jgi:hypothetical protein